MGDFFFKYEKLFYYVGVAAFLGIFAFTSYEKLLNMNFNGEVENVYYDAKGYPNVTINGENYNLDNNSWRSTTVIEQGDKLIKKKGEMDLKLIKRNGKDTVTFLDNNSN